jgi:hypothetical protein
MQNHLLKIVILLTRKGLNGFLEEQIYKTMFILDNYLLKCLI